MVEYVRNFEDMKHPIQNYKVKTKLSKFTSIFKKYMAKKTIIKVKRLTEQKKKIFNIYDKKSLCINKKKA